MKKNNYFMFFTPSIIVFIIILGIIIFPSESIAAAKNGLDIWVNILIPSLLPFIIGANLIVQLKFIDIIGLILNPLTNIIFNVSGKSALIFAISTVSGYPVGAKLASELRLNNEISQSEAQRLVSFCSTSGPLFIVGAVAIGMFNNPSLGYLLLLCHYLGSIFVGFLFKNFGEKYIPDKSSSIKIQLQSIIKNRLNNSEGFFVAFGNSVFSGVNTLLLVGGFVISFSVIFEILSLLNIISLISNLILLPLSLIGINQELCYAFISGFFEITIGCNQVSSITSSPEILRASLCSFLIAFSGLSILSQCCSFISKTDINTSLYIFSKFVHGLFSAIFTFFLYPFMNIETSTSNFTISTYYNMFDPYLDFVSFIIAPIFFIYILYCLFYLNNIIKKRKLN